MGAPTGDESGAVAPCTTCGRSDRVPSARLAERATCGSCQSSQPLLTQPIKRSSGPAFRTLRGDSTAPVLADVRAPWRSPCRRMAHEADKAIAWADAA